MTALVAGLALLGVACSPPYLPLRSGDVVASAAGPVEHAEGSFEGAGGVHLYEQWWRPRETPRATFVIVHGLKDHGSRYGELAERLVARGLAVYALDLRGHAHSEGVRVDVESFGDYVADLGIFVRQVRAREQDRPVFLLGHSMGGAIVASYLVEEKPALRGVIFHAAALRLDVSGVSIAGTKAMAAIAPRARLFQLDLDDFSRDPAVVQAAKDDPLVYQPGAPVRTARELINATDRTGDRFEEISAPLLILHGSADKLTAPRGSEELNRRAGSKDKTLKIYPQLAHDLVHEPEKETVLHDLIDWVDARASAAP